jgi:hypothetical protein
MAEAKEKAPPSAPAKQVRVLAQQLGPYKQGEITSDREVLALLNKPYGHKLVEAVLVEAEAVK